MAPGGAFIIEAYVPEPEDLDAQRRVEVRSVTEDSVELRMHRYNYEAQRFIRQTVVIADGSIQLKPFSLHYLWPEQIDELAAQAGLHLEARYSNWQCDPFGPTSTDHVSIYRKPE